MRKRKVLKIARARLEGHWTQRDLERDKHLGDESKVCAIGAVKWAVWGEASNVHYLKFSKRKRQRLSQLEIDARDTLDECVTKITGRRAVSAIGYNDEPGRTEDEVLALFDCAIES